MSNIANSERKPKSLGFKLLLVLGIFVLVLCICLGAFTAFILYVDRLAERRARELCDGIAIGSNVATAIASANREGISNGFSDDAHSVQDFYFRGYWTNVAVCEVSVSEDGNVKSKNSYMEYD